MSMEVGFEGLEVQCVIGILPQERTQKQPLIIDLRCQLQESKQPIQHVEDTVNYVALAQLCERRAVEGEYGLLETLAQDLLEEVSALPLVKGVQLTLKKPEALPHATYCVVKIQKGVWQ